MWQRIDRRDADGGELLDSALTQPPAGGGNHFFGSRFVGKDDARKTGDVGRGGLVFALADQLIGGQVPVSYTHLTLPTSDLV